MDPRIVRTSRFLCYVLRHRPDAIGLTLDRHGFADIAELLHRLQDTRHALRREQLDDIVATDDKQRYRISDDGRRIRCVQGHSVAIDLGLTPAVPPMQLFHGTAARFLSAIREQGLLPRKRQHVHLSVDATSAAHTGARHGEPVVLIVDSGAMHERGHTFLRADNGVWLTAAVPPDFLRLPD